MNKDYRFAFSGKSDIGVQRTVNEDYIDVLSLDTDTFLAVVSDGMGSLPGGLQPALLAVNEMTAAIRRYFEKRPDLLLSISEVILENCLISANRILNVFHLCDEERYSGFGASLTCCLVYRKESGFRCTIASIGNTRLYLLRANKDKIPQMHLLSHDQTKAAQMLADGIIDAEQYYLHPDRLILTGCLGMSAEPQIQIFEDMPLHSKDILLLTTDGIHYALRPEAIQDIILQSGDCESAIQGLIDAARLEKYPDNMSGVICYLP